MDSDTLVDLTRVKKWSVETETGDIGEVTNIKEDSKVLPFVTSTVDNCLGRDCPDYEDCYLVGCKKLGSGFGGSKSPPVFRWPALKDTVLGNWSQK